jgi:hypothetical protein
MLTLENGKVYWSGSPVKDIRLNELPADERQLLLVTISSHDEPLIFEASSAGVQPRHACIKVNLTPRS